MKRLVDMLLVVGDKFSDLYEHLILTILIKELVLANHLEKVITNDLLFDRLELIYQYSFTWDYLILVAHLIDEDLKVAIREDREWFGHWDLYELTNAGLWLEICLVLDVQEMEECLFYSQMMCLESVD